MKDFYWEILELKIWIMFPIILVMGIVAVLFYVAQERYKKQIVNNKEKYDGFVEHISLGNKYMIVTALLLFGIFLAFFAQSDIYERINNAVMSVCSGLSLLALKEYFRIYKGEDLKKQIIVVLCIFIILILIELLFYMLDWKDNPYHALTMGFGTWIISMFVEKWNKLSVEKLMKHF